jgi:hypothetical protein
MPTIQFPDVPDSLGVPNVLRNSANLTETNVLSAIYSGNPLSIIESILGSMWGIYTADGSTPVISPDGFSGFQCKGSSKISTYPVEAGGFASYNKVQMPYDVRMKMVCSGNIASSDITRMQFLTQLDVMKNSLDLYELVTPDYTYPNMNMLDYDYARTSENGVSLLMVEAYFQEVRVTAGAVYTNTASASSSSTVSRGNVSASSPTTQQSAAYSKSTVS